MARYVVNKAVRKVSDKIREETTMQVVEEYEEKNEHTFDNKAGADHVIGVYQWVDKVYEAQLYDYRTRGMYKWMVPEPGAFLAEAPEQDRAKEGGSSLSGRPQRHYATSEDPGSGRVDSGCGSARPA